MSLRRSQLEKEVFFFHSVSATSSEGPRNFLAGIRTVAADGCMGTAKLIRTRGELCYAQPLEGGSILQSPCQLKGTLGRSPDVYRNLQRDLSFN
jgi:hypothetical protein